MQYSRGRWPRGVGTLWTRLTRENAIFLYFLLYIPLSLRVRFNARRHICISIVYNIIPPTGGPRFVSPR